MVTVSLSSTSTNIAYNGKHKNKVNAHNQFLFNQLLFLLLLGYTAGPILVLTILRIVVALSMHSGIAIK